MKSEHKMYTIIWFLAACVVALALTYAYYASQSHGKNSAPIIDGDITCTYVYQQWHCNRIA